ncbi:MAG: hypothetical protein WD081_03790 [Gammaproteobacteria bacterium]
MKIRKRRWYPLASLEDKQNFKRLNLIYPDGSVVECVYLHVPDIRYREQLIFWHYIQHLVRHFIKEHIGLNILRRDNPWDFAVEISTGSRFNVEITSIADNPQQHKNNSREERLAEVSSRETLPLWELTRVEQFFPSDEVGALVANFRKAGVGDEELVTNPYFDNLPGLILSVAFQSQRSLGQLIAAAIEKKAAKAHGDKENTVLILDNRTGQYDLPDYFEALDSIQHLFSKWPFPEIWFYTGYYSDDDGANAEFSFVPIKLTHDQQRVISELQSDVDDDGIYLSKWPRDG